MSRSRNIRKQLRLRAVRDTASGRDQCIIAPAGVTVCTSRPRCEHPADSGALSTYETLPSIHDRGLQLGKPALHHGRLRATSRRAVTRSSHRVLAPIIRSLRTPITSQYARRSDRAGTTRLRAQQTTRNELLASRRWPNREPLRAFSASPPRQRGRHSWDGFYSGCRQFGHASPARRPVATNVLFGPLFVCSAVDNSLHANVHSAPFADARAGAVASELNHSTDLAHREAWWEGKRRPASVVLHGVDKGASTSSGAGRPQPGTLCSCVNGENEAHSIRSARRPSFGRQHLSNLPGRPAATDRLAAHEPAPAQRGSGQLSVGDSRGMDGQLAAVEVLSVS